MSQEKSIDPIEFRNALGAFATGVTVVTTNCDEVGRVGLTANSFNSVSLDPPMVLWSLAKTSKALKFFTDAQQFCVNILAADQVSISNHFASKTLDKFSTIAYKDGIIGTPVIDDCSASFECKTVFTYEGGDHLIFVGEVVNFIKTDKKALIYHAGSYAVSEPHPITAPKNADNPSKNRGFVDDYLDYLLAKATHKFEVSFQQHLDRRGIGKYQWRTLVTIADFNGITIDELMKIVLLEEDKQLELINNMIETGFIRSTQGQPPSYHLETKGEQEIIQLLAAAKAHEADTLGNFSLDESRTLKALLKRLL
ncbi:flavin reductase [Dasania marina]|uniref:flavin reductase n=1 Tax=Dasania marina TaxID=471499 RepID=UPI00035F4815|nr:flavin reductase [Dasania marina]